VTALWGIDGEAGQQPQFTPTEDALWHAFTDSGGTRDRENLFRHYQPLARRLAASFLRRDAQTPLEYDELFQLACTGLLESIDRFKPDLGVPFRYFANRRISGAILNGIVHYSELNQQMSARRRIERERLASLSTEQQMSDGLDGRLEFLSDIAAGLALGLMLEESRLYSEDGKDPAKNAFETMAWKQMVKLVRKEVASLPQRESDIMNWHYLHGLQFENIAKILNLSKGRISQLHSAAIALLRKRLLKAGHFRIEG
jgi:RNA polymerase sigma factor FliA